MKHKKTLEYLVYTLSALTTVSLVSLAYFSNLPALQFTIVSLFFIASVAFLVASNIRQTQNKTVNLSSSSIHTPNVVMKDKVSGNFSVENHKGVIDISIDLSFSHSGEVSHKSNVLSQNFKVLVVDDNLTNQLLICSNLEKLGCKVSKAFNGVQAVKSVTEASYDLILMDLNMPVMNGLDATRKIRQIDSLNVETPVVALTPAPNSMNKEECQKYGMNGCLAKPLSRKSIRKLLELLQKESISWQEID